MELQTFDVSKYLDNEEIIAEYLNVALEEGDTELFMQALGDVAKARGMTNIAKETGLGRESLYKTLSGNVAPHFPTVLKIMTAMGLNMQVRKTL